MDEFFNNVKKIREAGCSFLIQINLVDEYLPHLDKIKYIVEKRTGALPQVAATRNELGKEISLLTKYTPSEYYRFGNDFRSPLFDFTIKNFMVKRKEFCYAGDWSFTLNLSNGEMRKCYFSDSVQNIFLDIDKPITIEAIGNNCKFPYCINSSHFLSLGVIPSISTPSYADLRNRKCSDWWGGDWYTPGMRNFLSGKLIENNQEYSIGLSTHNSDSNSEFNSVLDIFKKRRDQYGAMICSYLLGLRPVHLLTQLPGNIGDHLIWAGTEDLLKSNGIGFSEISVSDFGTGKCLGNTLVIPGSGALTTRYHEWLPALILKASLVFNRVVILPSGYDASVPIVAEALSRPNVFAFARDRRSYREIKPFGRAALAFDSALYFSGFCDLSVGSTPSVDSENRLVCLREDLGSPLTGRDFRPNPLYNNDISLTSAGLDEFLQKIRVADFVITDRLHVAVAAVMSGKRIQYLDPYDEKISAYFSFAFRETFEHLAVPCTIEWLQKYDFIIPKGGK